MGNNFEKCSISNNHPDLDKRTCSDCDKMCYVITVEPADDPNAYLLTDGVWVESLDSERNSFVLCDDCAEKLYDAGKLGYSCSGAFLV